MTLIVDNRAAVPGPGLHALVVGVSEYRYLPVADDPPLAESWNLRSLGSTAIAAATIADWLRQAGDLRRPLKTLRLMLSSTAIEEPLLHGYRNWAGEPTRSRFEEEARAWRKDCTDSPDSIALLYFAGHGFARGRGDVNLLLTMADLFDAATTRLARTVLASNLLNGMAPQSTTDTVARQQFFFFDCCRSFPAQMNAFDDRTVAPVFDVLATEGVPDNRINACLYAVPDNDTAFASRGSPTYFATALMDALEHAGRNVPGSGWCLDGDSIFRRMRARYEATAGRALDQRIIGKGPVLRNLATAPLVDLAVHLEPNAGSGGRSVGLERIGNPMVVCVENAPGWHQAQVPPGEYELKIMPPAGGWTINDRQIVLPDFENPWIARGWP